MEEKEMNEIKTWKKYWDLLIFFQFEIGKKVNENKSSNIDCHYQNIFCLFFFFFRSLGHL